LRQIVLNLVSNAVKFTDVGGRVLIKAEAGPEGFRLAVSDSGIGMTAEDLERVMEPFVQADSRLSRKYEGTGLGLPLTKALVAAHGGTLTLESQVDVGTTATILFPPARVVRDPASARAIEGMPGGGPA
ncbi:MAG: ATP-binding protein, partial [Pseudomonadota bacterium]